MEREWLLKRNCSMSPRQVGLAHGSLGLFVLGIAAAFAFQGAWFVFAFAVLELAGLALALLHYARHATDRERIWLEDGRLLIERMAAGQVHRIALDACWTRIAVPDRSHALIGLESRGVKVDIGALVSEKARRQVAHDMRRQVRANSLLF